MSPFSKLFLFIFFYLLKKTNGKMHFESRYHRVRILCRVEVVKKQKPTGQTRAT